MLNGLAQQGIIIGRTTLAEQLQKCGIRKYPQQPTSPELISLVDNLFHHTFLSDSEIAERIRREHNL
jgi:hypothetical protein